MCDTSPTHEYRFSEGDSMPDTRREIGGYAWKAELTRCIEHERQNAADIEKLLAAAHNQATITLLAQMLVRITANLDTLHELRTYKQP